MAYGLYEYWNSFMQWRENSKPTDKVVILYFSLLDTFNRRGWQRWIGVDTQRLMLLANTTNKATAFRARDVLVKAGFLAYKSGKKGKPTEYCLLKYGIKSTTENVTESTTENATTHYYIKKQKLKQKQRETPPLSPPSEPKQDTLLQRFDEFWQQYPKKVGKQAALASWKRIHPDAVLFEKIIQAVSAAKNSDQWQRDNGRFIPNPTTWLNQGRWDDELPQTQKEGMTNEIPGTGNGTSDSEWAPKFDEYGCQIL